MFKKIGQRIRKVRLEHGIKQKDLAKKINISQGALTNFELGRRKISLEWLLKISHALEVPVGYFHERRRTPARGGHARPRRSIAYCVRFDACPRDPRLQMELLHVMERMSHHLERAARAGRAAPA